MKYVCYFLIPFLISTVNSKGYSFHDELDCSYTCQIKDFVQTLNESLVVDEESIVLGSSHKGTYGIFIMDIVEHPVDDMMQYHKAFVFAFDKQGQLIRDETLELDIFIEHQATLNDFATVAKSFYLGITRKLNFNGAIVAGKYLSRDQKLYKFERESTDFIPIVDARNDNREETKDCYTAWFGYYIGGVFRPIYIIAVWCTNNGNTGGGGTGGGTGNNWPRVCNEHRSLSWTGVFGNYSSSVEARLTKLSAGHWPRVSVSHVPGVGGNTNPGTISLSATGGYLGNGRADATAYLTHVLTVGGNTVSSEYGPKVVFFQFPGTCY